jgi:hypothetical protein
MQVVNYSDKAIAVIGNTKQVKDRLMQLGGKFNPYLKCGAGWIFSKKKEAAVLAFVSGQQVAEPAMAGYIQAQEEAYFDNFCRANNL